MVVSIKGKKTGFVTKVSHNEKTSIGGDNLADWPVHPVIHIDFTTILHRTPDEVNASLMRFFNETVLEHELPPLEFSSPGEMLKSLMVRMLNKYGKKNRVVLIIDEYDKPLFLMKMDLWIKLFITLNLKITLSKYYRFSLSNVIEKIKRNS